jgi:hypothetical protein
MGFTVTIFAPRSLCLSILLSGTKRVETVDESAALGNLGPQFNSRVSAVVPTPLHEQKA